MAGNSIKIPYRVLFTLLLASAMDFPANAQTVPEPPESSRTETSLFDFLNMSGRTRANYQPLTSKERARFYTRGLFGPVTFLSAGISAGIGQAKNDPPAWGQGAEGYGARFGNYFAKQALQRTLRFSGESLLHEDNRYYSSGEHGGGRRVLYALKSSVMARSDDGRQHISASEIGSLAGAAFISRLWQPSTNDSAKDGLTSFLFSMGATAGTNVLREFLPDLTQRMFRRGPRSAGRNHADVVP